MALMGHGSRLSVCLDGVSTLEGEREVAIGPISGQFSSAGDHTILNWTDMTGQQWSARGWQVNEENLTAVAAVVSVDATGTVIVTATPAGYVVAPPELAAALGRYSEYEFSRDDGATVQLSFYPGGAQAHAGRASGDEVDRASVALGDETVSLLTYRQGGRYRANLVRGFWAWELDGEPFTSAEEFLALVAAVKIIDEGTWRTLLPESVVAGGDDRAAVVEQLLVGIPVPEGFDISHLDGTAERYQLIAQTSGAVACAWLDLWFDATAAGDSAAAAASAAALATAHSWPMLTEIESQGRWSQALWQFADAVNGGPGVASGNGPQPPTRAAAESGLGCNFR